MIDLRQLRYFVAVCDHLHFTRAADSLHVAQSALSAQVKRLEEDLGIRLIERGKRSAASLTDAGALFLTEARQTLAQAERAEQVGRLAARGAMGKIDIGHIASAVVDGTLARALSAYRITHPHVVINLTHMETQLQLRALTEGVIDVAFVRPRSDYPVGIGMKEVGRAPLLLALPANSAMARLDVIGLRHLHDHQFIIPQFAEGVAFSQQLDHLRQLIGGPWRPPIKVADFFSALALVAAGYGATLIPGYFAKVDVEGVVLRPIEQFAEDAVLMMAWRKGDSSPALAAFLQQAGRNRAGPA